MSSRRFFLKTSTFTLAASAFNPLLSKAGSSIITNNKVTEDLFLMGMAGYTFHHSNIEQTIAIMQQVGVTALSIKDFHLPMDSTQAVVDEIKAKFQAAGISIYAAGVIYMKTQAEADQAFAYTKKIGVDLIIGSPNPELLPYVEQKVKSFGIRLAIHNHGPEDKLYPGPKDIFDKIKDMDSRIGICLDIGHAIRAGADPAKAVVDYSGRIFDLHIKDVAEATTSDKAVAVGRGIIDFPALVQALKKIQFKGRCSIEFEQDVKDPLPGIAESVGFFKGVMRSFR